MIRALLLFAGIANFAAASGIIYFMRGHEVAAFLLILTSAVFVVGACLVHAIEEVAYQSARAGRNEMP